jgi:hypothetical protein
MALKTFHLIGIEHDEVRENEGNLRLVCLIEGWGETRCLGQCDHPEEYRHGSTCNNAMQGGMRLDSTKPMGHSIRPHPFGT